MSLAKTAAMMGLAVLLVGAAAPGSSRWRLDIPTLVAFLFATLYAGFWLLVRWHHVAKPNRRLVFAQIESVRMRGELEQDRPNQETALERKVRSNVDSLLKKAGALASESSWWDRWFWSRGQEIAAWWHIHEAQRQLVAILPRPRVCMRLATVADELAATGKPEAKSMALRISRFLGSDLPLPRSNAGAADGGQGAGESGGGGEAGSNAQTALMKAPAPEDGDGEDGEAPPTVEVEGGAAAGAGAQGGEAEGGQVPAGGQTLAGSAGPAKTGPCKDLMRDPRALLQEALGILYDNRDASFADLVSLNNKSNWFVGVALILIVSLAYIGNPILLLMGAAGGFVSRLSGMLKTESKSADYGAYWTTLFLSPVLGSLTGWFGILLVIGLGDINVLSQEFANIDWEKVSKAGESSQQGMSSLSVWALAFLLGFSERLFNGLADVLEKKATPPPQGQAAPPAS
jgi:hypothetical protein